ncbi:MAG: MMPL family transporter [Gammaproteobacteria bacterium]|nr:MMPL family transporter [Gammaproteobacteria bacterium]
MVDSKYIEIVTKKPYLVIVAIFGIAAMLASGAANLKFTSDYKIYFSGDDPNLQAYEKIQNEYAQNENILFVVTPKDNNIFTRDSLQAVQKLTESAWQLPFSIRVDSITNYQFARSINDEIVIEQLPGDLTGMTVGKISDFKQRTLAETELLNRLISKNGGTTGINVSINLPGNDVEKTAMLVASARDLVNEIESEYKDIDIYLTGTVVFNNAFPEVSQQDMTVLVSLMYLIVFGVLVWFLRSILATLGILITTILSIAIALGAIGWLGYQLNPATASAPMIILTLAVANGVHLLTTYFSFVEDGADKKEAIPLAVKKNLLPLTITDVTTVTGFLCLNFSDSPPFHDLGNTVAIGIASIYLLTLFLLPALISILPLRRKDKAKGFLWLDNLGVFVIEKKASLAIIILSMGLVLSYCITLNELDDKFVDYFDETIDFRRATDYTVDNLTGIYTIQYSIPADGENQVLDPKYLNSLDKLANWFRKQPATIHVSAATDLVKRLNRSLNNGDESYYTIPTDRRRVAENLLVYEMSLPYGLGLDDRINLVKSETRLTVILQNMSTQELLELESRAKRWMKKNTPEWSDVIAASPNLMFAHISSQNIKSMLLGNTVALVLISILIIIALRNIKVGSIAILTNLLPAAMAFGLWGILYKEVGLSLSVVTCMTLGIIVDDTVYFLNSYLSYRRKQKHSPELAIRKTFSSVGQALWITSVALIAGFAVLSLSHFKLNSSMAMLTAITIACALVVDFLLLPALILFLDKKKIVIKNTLDIAHEKPY